MAPRDKKQNRHNIIEPAWPIGSLITLTRTFSLVEIKIDDNLLALGCKRTLRFDQKHKHKLDHDVPLVYLGTMFSSYDEKIGAEFVGRYLLFLSSDFEILSFYHNWICDDANVEKNMLTYYFRCLLRSDKYA